MEEKEGYEKIPKKSIGDHLFTAGKVGASLVPGGGAVNELFSALVNPPLQRRKDEWVYEVITKLKELDQKGKFKFEDLGENEEFISILMHSLQIAMRNHKREKLEGLRNAVLNTALNIDIEEDQKFLLINYLDFITPVQIILLDFYDDPRGYAEKHEITYDMGNANSHISILEQAFPSFADKSDLIEIYFTDLVNKGLLRNVSLTSYGLPATMFIPLTTDIGKKFLRFTHPPVIAIELD